MDGPWLAGRVIVIIFTEPAANTIRVITAALTSADEPADNPRNNRNGYAAKTVQSEHGALELAIPRDRQSTFEPGLVPKQQRRLTSLDEKIVTLFARGLSTHDLALQLEVLHGV